MSDSQRGQDGFLEVSQAARAGVDEFGIGNHDATIVLLSVSVLSYGIAFLPKVLS